MRARPKALGDRRPHPNERPHLGETPHPAPQTQAQTPGASALTGPMLMHLVKRSSAAMCSYSFWVAHCLCCHWLGAQRMQIHLNISESKVQQRNVLQREKNFHAHMKNKPFGVMCNCSLGLFTSLAILFGADNWKLPV